MDLANKCKHKNLNHYEIIEASHGSHYDDNGNIWFNNEYGNIICYTVICYECDKIWRVKKSSPKFIINFHDKVQKDREAKLYK